MISNGGGTEPRWSRGILAERGQKVAIDETGKKKVVGSLGDSAELAKAIKKGEWNEYVITARGNHLTQTINGKASTMIMTDRGKPRRT